MIGQFILRIVIWFLLTANLSVTNIIIGVIISLLMPHYQSESIRFKDIVQGIGRIIKAVPRAYIEGIAMVCQPHKYEEVHMKRTENRRSAGLIFLDVFLITFTPKTVVLGHHEDGWYVIHRVVRRISKRQSP